MAVVQQIKVPLISVNDTSLTVAAITKAYGSAVKKGEVIMVFETSKTTYDVVAEADGFVEYCCVENEDYEVNIVVANIYADALEVPAKLSVELSNHSLSSTPVQLHMAVDWQGDTLFSSAAIQLMIAKGIGREVFAGFDFVSADDVLKLHNGVGNTAVQDQPKSNVRKQQKPIPVDATRVIVEKLSSNKKREIEYLSAVQEAGLTSTINTSVNTQGIFVHLNQVQQFLKNSLLPLIIYESARLLKKYPLLNAYYTGDAVAVYKEVHVGFAIDIDKGLKVLKVADTINKTVPEIEDSIMNLSAKYLDDALALEELTDVTFTITDLSAEGVTFFRPLINAMNSSILGVSSIEERQQHCILSLSFDHRVTEGKAAARFLNELKLRLESYRSVHHPVLNMDITCFKCFKSLEEDLSQVGFAKCITPKGEEAYICQSCLKGF